jgi:hypothetical protein
VATPRASALAAAAAVLLLAVGVGTVGLLDSYSGRVSDDAQLAAESDRAGQEEYGAEKPGEEMVGAAAPSETASAPSYIALDGAVWIVRGTGEVDESVLATAGTVTTDLGTGSPVSQPAYHVGTDESILWVREGDDGYLWFERVTRTLGRRLYGLVTGSGLVLFGDWPSLPDRFAPPETPDGAPSFRFLGSDDLGVNVYVPVDGTAEEGIAVPPDQAPDDPAAGNPQWTWWEPVF